MKNQTIKLDALKASDPITGKSFPLKVATNILAIQLRNGKSDWTINPSEKKEFVDGEIRSIKGANDSKSEAKG